MGGVAAPHMADRLDKLKSCRAEALAKGLDLFDRVKFVEGCVK